MDPSSAAAAATGGIRQALAGPQIQFFSPVPVPVPQELQGAAQQAEAYAEARIRSFAQAFAQQLGSQLSPEQVDFLATGILCAAPNALQEPVPQALQALPAAKAVQAAAPQSIVHLSLDHDCLSYGCGDSNCELCRFNPSRRCRQHLKPKYLIDDFLRAKCGAPLYVKLLDDQGQPAVAEEQSSMLLQVHLINGEKYRELATAGELTLDQLYSCVLAAPAGQKPLLKREGSGVPASLNPCVFFQLQGGQAVLSDLQCTTSSEALLQGKAPTFRLLILPVDSAGEPLPSVRSVVSESFVVATKRVKHALKNDIPSVMDDITKLVHVGKATVDKLRDIAETARSENVHIHLPPHLMQGVEKVGQFRELVELTERNHELKQKLRQLLKFPAEKWDELAQHALVAVMPDFRPRVWWCVEMKGGLVFPSKGSAPQLDQQPLAWVFREAPGSPEDVLEVNKIPGLMNLLPGLKDQARLDWFTPNHNNWSIYWNDAADPFASQLQGLALGPSLGINIPLGVRAAAEASNNSSNRGAAAAAAAAANTWTTAPHAASPGGVLHEPQQNQQNHHQQNHHHQQQQQQPVAEYPPPGAPFTGLGAQQLRPLLPQEQQQQHQQQPQQQHQQPGLMGPPPPRSPPAAVEAHSSASAAALAGVHVPIVTLPLPGQLLHLPPEHQHHLGHDHTCSPFAGTAASQLLGPPAATAAAAAAAAAAELNGSSATNGSAAAPRLQQSGQKRQAVAANGITSVSGPAATAAATADAQGDPNYTHYQHQHHQQLLHQHQHQQQGYHIGLSPPPLDGIASPVGGSSATKLPAAPMSIVMEDAHTMQGSGLPSLLVSDAMQGFSLELEGLNTVDFIGMNELTDVMASGPPSVPVIAATGDSLIIGDVAAPDAAPAAAAGGHVAAAAAAAGAHQKQLPHQQQLNDLSLPSGMLARPEEEVEALSLLVSDSLDLSGLKSSSVERST